MNGFKGSKSDMDDLVHEELHHRLAAGLPLVLELLVQLYRLLVLGCQVQKQGQLVRQLLLILVS